LGRLLGGPFGVRHAVVEANLVRAFPDRDLEWRRRMARESWEHLGREGVVALRLASLGREQILSRTDVEGLEALLEAVRGPGAVMTTGHMGNWEIAGAALALRGVPVDALAVRQRNPMIDAALVATREEVGIRITHRGGGAGHLLESLRNGRVPALLADQDGGRDGVFVYFLGHEASTPRGPALLALRSGARLFAGACLSQPGRPRRYRLFVEPIEVERTGDLAEDLRRVTQAHANVLARYVRMAPEQYFWPHNRWKTQRGETPLTRQ
jgi:KDO2-lipid IV(A) lauroyltransferase